MSEAGGAPAVEAIRVEVAKLDLAPGDAVVMRFGNTLPSAGAISTLQQGWAAIFPGNPLLVLDSETEVSVLKRGERA